MGQFLSSSWFWQLFGANKEYRILMVGLDSAGKTAILYALKLGKMATTNPTIGFEIQHFVYRNVTLTIWDLGGGSKIRTLWKHYFADTQGAIFVVDSADRERLAEARDSLHAAFDDFLSQGLYLLVLANKQDLPDALSPAEVTQALDLQRLKVKWHVQGSSATTGQGLEEGLRWLEERLR